MSILRQEKRDTYTVIGNQAIMNEGLSFKALGLLVYLLSKPDGWTINLKQIARNRADGYAAIRSAMDELLGFGYATRTTIRGLNGVLMGSETTIHETPVKVETPRSGFLTSDNRTTEGMRNPRSGFPTSDNRTGVNTDLFNTEVVKELSPSSLDQKTKARVWGILNDPNTAISGRQILKADLNVLLATIRLMDFSKRTGEQRMVDLKQFAQHCEKEGCEKVLKAIEAALTHTTSQARQFALENYHQAITTGAVKRPESRSKTQEGTGTLGKAYERFTAPSDEQDAGLGIQEPKPFNLEQFMADVRAGLVTE